MISVEISVLARGISVEEISVYCVRMVFFLAITAISRVSTRKIEERKLNDIVKRKKL